MPVATARTNAARLERMKDFVRVRLQQGDNEHDIAVNLGVRNDWTAQQCLDFIKSTKAEGQQPEQPEQTQYAPEPAVPVNDEPGIDITTSTTAQAQVDAATKASEGAKGNFPRGEAAAIAEKFVKAGGHVIFFPRGTKRCTVPGWEEKATNDLATALALASEDPFANVGIVGKENGLWGLDDDAGLVAEYEKEYGPIPTYTTRTVSDGRHFIFRSSAASWAMGNLTIKDEDGRELLSCRINNRYVVAAGSWAHPHNDASKPLTQYTAVNPDAPFNEAPATLLEFVQRKKAEIEKKSSTKPATGVTGAKNENGNRRIYREGGRNQALTSLAGTLRAAGSNEGEILTTISRLNQEQCEPPLPEHEVKSIAHSVGTNYPPGQWEGLAMSDAAKAAAAAMEIPIIDDTEEENDPRFEMHGDTFDSNIYEKLSQRTTLYPDPGDGDLLTLAAKAQVHGTNIPLGYVREPLKQMMLHVLDGKLFHPAYPKLNLRGIHVNLGDSWGGKTTGLEYALEAGRPILAMGRAHPQSLFAYKSETVFIRSFTPEGTIKRDAKGLIKSGSAGHPSQYLHVKEGNQIATCNSNYFVGVWSKLVDLYDQTEAETQSITNGDFNANLVKASTVMCFTPSDFNATFGGKGTIGGGGLGRCTIVNPPTIDDYDNKDWERLPELVIQKKATQLGERIYALLQGSPRTLEEEPGAREIRLRVKAILKKAGKVGKRLDEYFVREQIALAASLDGRLVMTTKQAEYAERWVMAQLQTRVECWPNDAGSPIEAVEHTVRKTVTTHFVSETKIKDACNYYREGSGGHWVFNSGLKNAIRNGDVKWTGVTRKGIRTYCPGSCGIHTARKWEEY